MTESTEPVETKDETSSEPLSEENTSMDPGPSQDVKPESCENPRQDAQASFPETETKSEVKLEAETKPESKPEAETKPGANHSQEQKGGRKKRGGGDRENVIGIRLPGSSMTWRIRTKLYNIRTDDEVFVETRNGEATARVMYLSSPEVNASNMEPVPGQILRVVRKVTAKDREAMAWRTEKEQEAKVTCKEAIRELKLPMKLSRVEYQSSGNKAVFYFTAENRVDFRELVRKLARALHIRVEMRQVGVRDESRLLGGLGPCGEALCCVSHLNKFHPVSVRMAKNQDLSLNPDAISGVCGRLMCCLAFENQSYVDARKTLPKIKNRVWNQQGREGVVRGVLPLQDKIEVQFPDGETVVTFASEISRTPPLDSTPKGEGKTLPASPAEPPKQTPAPQGESRRPSKQNQGRKSRNAPPSGKNPGKSSKKGAPPPSSRGKHAPGGQPAPSSANPEAPSPTDTLSPSSTEKGPAPSGQELEAKTALPGSDEAAKETPKKSGKRRRRRRSRRRRSSSDGNTKGSGGNQQNKPAAKSPS
ncbi:MAG: hypothetical protein HQL52_06055 [Magnetococcales bacterium]|nr:hypothetical protein [Magnetococcales bacterium]